MYRPFGSLEVGKEYQVIVKKILVNGIIVQINDTKFTDFIHISKISESFVCDINEYVHVGDTLTAIAVKSLTKRNDKHDGLELSLQCCNCIQGTVPPEKRLNEMIFEANNILKSKLQVMQKRNQRRRK